MSLNKSNSDKEFKILSLGRSVGVVFELMQRISLQLRKILKNFLAVVKISKCIFNIPLSVFHIFFKIAFSVIRAHLFEKKVWLHIGR
jgi:hypothetical protein